MSRLLDDLQKLRDESSQSTEQPYGALSGFVRAHFDEISEAREKGYQWEAIADVLGKYGSQCKPPLSFDAARLRAQFWRESRAHKRSAVKAPAAVAGKGEVGTPVSIPGSKLGGSFRFDPGLTKDKKT